MPKKKVAGMMPVRIARPAHNRKSKSAGIAHAVPPTPVTRYKPAAKRVNYDLAKRFGITESNLEERRRFVRLGEEDRALLIEMEAWAMTAAPQIAREFYDWQFSFRPTLEFFEGIARQKQMSLSALREILEQSQAGYIVGVFEGAHRNWSLEYFEERLHVGWVHDQINLPFKWYIGSYSEMQRLISQHLRQDLKKEATAARVEQTIFKVFNYDMQAIGDSFLLSTLESMGLDVAAIPSSDGGDKTENLAEVKRAIQILTDQCSALAERRLDDAVFESSNPCAGKFGKAFAEIRTTFRESITQIAQSASAVAAAAEQLTAVSHQMSANADETARQAKVVATASDEVSLRVETVATSSQAMQTAIQEISKSATGSAKVAHEAVSAADSARHTIQQLGDSSTEIEKVIKVINSIAQQTNFLALNATIEAARAGEAGKGFAVVANEVKELAKRTGGATEEIGRKMEVIQHDTKSAVDAISRIARVITEVNDNSNNIAAAVEEQTVTSHEINRNVEDAAAGAKEIASTIGSVAIAAQDTTKGASDTQVASKSLSEMALELQTLVGRFQV